MEKGSIEEKGPRLHWYYMVAREFHRFPNAVQRAVWTANRREDSLSDQSIKVLSSDELEYTLNVGLSWHVDPAKGCAAKLFRKYGKSLQQIEQTEVCDVVRTSMQQVFSTYDGAYIYGPGRPEVVEEIDQKIRNSTLAEVKAIDGEQCFKVENFRLLGMNPPKRIQEAINDKLAAQQEAQAGKQKRAQKSSWFDKLVRALDLPGRG